MLLSLLCRKVQFMQNGQLLPHVDEREGYRLTIQRFMKWINHEWPAEARNATVLFRSYSPIHFA